MFVVNIINEKIKIKKKLNEKITVYNLVKLISKSFLKECVFAIKDNKKEIPLSYVLNSNCSIYLVLSKDNINKKLTNYCVNALLEIISSKIHDILIKNISYNEEYFTIDFDTKNDFKNKDLVILNNKLFKQILNFKYQKKFLVEPNWFRNFKFLNISGVYVDGNKNNKMITRITGIVGINKKDLEIKEKKFIDKLESDHRYINSKLKIFTFSSLVGAGLPIWLPNGVILKNRIASYLKKIERKYKFLEVNTPLLGTKSMYLKSGHWNHYKNFMFPSMKIKDEEFILRPMTCPHHIMIFNNELRSYHDLPLRLSENADMFRYEPSGSLTGLERVRMMNLTDSHIFVTKEQLKSEFKNCFNLIKEVLDTFKINIFYFSLSLRDKKNKEKYYNDDSMWNQAELELKSVLDEMKIPYKTMIGEAAFYGPKLDIQILTALKHEITISTIQFDFLSAKNFNAKYINKENKRLHPIIIHRGLIGTYERFIAILLEQTKGNLPLWLALEQVRIIPISEDNNNYLRKITKELDKENILYKIDNSNNRLNYKVRQAQINKIPYQIIIGKNEIETKTVNYRIYSSNNDKNINYLDFILMLKQQIKKRE